MARHNRRSARYISIGALTLVTFALGKSLWDHVRHAESQFNLARPGYVFSSPSSDVLEIARCQDLPVDGRSAYSRKTREAYISYIFNNDFNNEVLSTTRDGRDVTRIGTSMTGMPLPRPGIVFAVPDVGNCENVMSEADYDYYLQNNSR